jgi:hypothetical protein
MRTGLALALLALAACDSTGPAPGLVGEYRMTEVDGSPLPYDASWTDAFGEVNDRMVDRTVLIISDQGTWSETLDFSNHAGPWTTVRTGTWEPVGAAGIRLIHAYPFDADSTDGSLVRGGLSLARDHVHAGPVGAAVYARNR